LILAFGQLLVARMRKPSAAANTESEAARARVLLRLAADRQIEEAESLRSQGTKESGSLGFAVKCPNILWS